MLYEITIQRPITSRQSASKHRLVLMVQADNAGEAELVARHADLMPHLPKHERRILKVELRGTYRVIRA